MQALGSVKLSIGAHRSRSKPIWLSLPKVHLREGDMESLEPRLQLTFSVVASELTVIVEAFETDAIRPPDRTLHPIDVLGNDGEVQLAEEFEASLPTEKALSRIGVSLLTDSPPNANEEIAFGGSASFDLDFFIHEDHQVWSFAEWTYSFQTSKPTSITVDYSAHLKEWRRVAFLSATPPGGGLELTEINTGIVRGIPTPGSSFPSGVYDGSIRLDAPRGEYVLEFSSGIALGSHVDDDSQGFLAEGGSRFDVTWKFSTSKADLNRDETIDALDIDVLMGALRATQDPSVEDFDLNGDLMVDQEDVTYLVEDVLQTRRGDVDLDGDVDFQDFVILSINYGTENGWGFGELDGDGVVGFSDFLLLAEVFEQDL